MQRRALIIRAVFQSKQDVCLRKATSGRTEQKAIHTTKSCQLLCCCSLSVEAFKKLDLQRNPERGMSYRLETASINLLLEWVTGCGRSS